MYIVIRLYVLVSGVFGILNINSRIWQDLNISFTVSVFFRFKPEGTGSLQGLVHNSGCGPSDIGPSVFIGLDRNTQLYGQDMINLKFATVPQKQNLEYNFVNVSVPVGSPRDICTFSGQKKSIFLTYRLTYFRPHFLLELITNGLYNRSILNVLK